MRKRCKHIYALIYYINSDQSASKTSYEKEWGKPSASQLAKAMYSKGKEISELFPQRIDIDDNSDAIEFSHHEFNGWDCAIKDILISKMRNAEDLKGKAALRDAEIAENIHIEGEALSGCISLFIELSCSNQLYGEQMTFLSEFEKEYFKKNVCMNEEDIKQLCLSTRNQSTCQGWSDARKVRITASTKAHAIKRLQRKKKEDLAQDFIAEKLISNQNLEYGSSNENKAIDNYKKVFNVQVVKAGFFLHPLQPWLGASVDGIVIDNRQVTRILEVKCPISCTAKPIFDPEKNTCNVGYLKLENKQVYLKESHQYFTQCQMQLYVTGMSICDLFVWSPKGSCRVEIYRNEEFLADVVPRLTHFYFFYYLKALCNK